MNWIQQWREFEYQKEAFRHLEKALDLPKDSIQSPYEKELVLTGMQIDLVKLTHKQLLEIATQTPFSYDTVIAVHREVNDVDLTKNILEVAAQNALGPFSIIKLMRK